MELRPLQEIKKAEIYNAWENGIVNIANVDACGTGKTVLTAKILEENDTPSCVIAHRQELVCQISTALAANGVYHRIIGPKKVIKMIVKNHLDTVGKNYFLPSSRIGVAGVDTLIRRTTELQTWCDTVKLWTIDECHHLLKSNKWGTAVKMFSPESRGLGMTATFCRNDNKGLGRKADGFFDTILNGPSARDQINAGFLTDYRIFAPTTKDFNRANIPVNTVGEFTKEGVVKETKNSAIIGDVVKHYLRIAKGKLGITFMPNVEIATDTAREFNNKGVPAVVITADTPLDVRVAAIKKFENREILQLVNVDLFGEGFDLPAIEVVQLARATNSYSLYHQQFMRALRLMLDKNLLKNWGNFTDLQRLAYIAASDKPYAIIIDHVCNINTEHGGHGLPDMSRIYTLDRTQSVNSDIDKDVIPTRRCLNPLCNGVYERIKKICPYCNEIFIPTIRSDPEFVDGDLTELDQATLAAMRNEIAIVDMSRDEYQLYMESKHAPYIHKHLNDHHKQQLAQAALRSSMAWWCGYQRARGRPDDESYRRFYFLFKIDVLNAQSLKTNDTFKLVNNINEVLISESKSMGY